MSSLGKPQNGFACTIMISPVLSSKFPLPVLTAGPIDMLVIARTEYSWSDFWAIAVVANGAGATSLFVGGLADEEMLRDRFFLRSASRFLVKFIGKSKLVSHYLVFIYNRRKLAKLSYYEQWLLHMHIIMNMS